ncbi:MAG: rhodanese-like domain-containing protein [Candidatus Eisenbacteria bacterium]
MITRGTVPPTRSSLTVMETPGCRALVPLVATVLGLLLFLLPVSVFGQAWPGRAKREPVPEPDYPDITVTAELLAGRLDARDVVVIDSRSTSLYRAGHVPGAISFPPESFPEVESPPDLARLQDVLGELGLTGRERLICCGEMSYSGEAARLFWLLEVAGAGRVALLDGGVAGWRAAGHALASEPTVRAPAEWAPEPATELLATREYVRRSFGEPDVEIIDARGRDAWLGPVEREEWGTLKRVGHVPHALPFDFTCFFAPDGTLLEPGETWSSFARLGPRPANPVDLSVDFVVHGWGMPRGDGFGKSEDEAWGDGPLGYFLLRRAGIARVRLYPGGWRDWSGDPYLPVVRVVNAEELMHRLRRSRHWLRPDAPREELAFFDVRHPADHARGHIGGSVSLRSDYFADSLDVRIERYWPDIDRLTTPVVTYCYGEDCIRSRATSTAAAKKGFVYIERFVGGLDEWRYAGGELVRGEW